MASLLSLDAPRSLDPRLASPLFRLPPELREKIYNHARPTLHLTDCPLCAKNTAYYDLHFLPSPIYCHEYDMESPDQFPDCFERCMTKAIEEGRFDSEGHYLGKGVDFGLPRACKRM